MLEKQIAKERKKEIVTIMSHYNKCDKNDNKLIYTIKKGYYNSSNNLGFINHGLFKKYNTDGTFMIKGIFNHNIEKGYFQKYNKHIYFL